MLPPEDGPRIPPPISRPLRPPTTADDIDRQKDTERILALFNPELRAILSGIPVERVPSLQATYRGRTAPVLGLYIPAESSGGRGRIQMVEPQEDYESLLLEELLHGANFEYEPYLRDAQQNWQGLFGPLSEAFGGRMPQQYLDDPPHAFTFGAQQSLRNAPNVPLDLYRYFLPLRQGVLTD